MISLVLSHNRLLNSLPKRILINSHLLSFSLTSISSTPSSRSSARSRSFHHHDSNTRLVCLAKDFLHRLAIANDLIFKQKSELQRVQICFFCKTRFESVESL